MALSYVQQGEYFFPKLCFEAENPPIGKYGLLRKSYLKEHKRGWYSRLLLTGKLDEQLAEVDHSCTGSIDVITNQFAQREGVTEALKAAD